MVVVALQVAGIGVLCRLRGKLNRQHCLRQATKYNRPPGIPLLRCPNHSTGPRLAHC